jgi:molybdopterin converting factor subunit 1
MKVRVKMFAVARQRVGSDTIELDLPADASISQLRSVLAASHPPLADVLPHARFAVNSEYAADSHTIPAAAEVAIIPPVSGG